MAAADYSKLTLYEQIMLRTETYLGSKEQVKGPQWLVGTQGDWKYQESMKYTPAFLKMFDEIAVNAADNTVRHDNTKTFDLSLTKKIILSQYTMMAPCLPYKSIPCTNPMSPR